MANLQEKPAEPEHLARAVHVLNVGMVVSMYGGVLSLFSMSHRHLHTLYTLPQRVWAYRGLSHTHTHTHRYTQTCLVSSTVYFFLLFAGRVDYSQPCTHNSSFLLLFTFISCIFSNEPVCTTHKKCFPKLTVK